MSTISSAALANNGIEFPGYDTQAIGMGGAGAANPLTSQAAATNPAGMAMVGNRFDVNALVLSASIKTQIAGKHYSSAPFSGAPLPSFTYQLSDKWTVGSSLYGFGIINNYGEPLYGATTKRTAVSLYQFVWAPTVAYRINDRHAVGVSLLLAAQRLNIKGFEGFGIENPGSAWSYGAGVSVGWTGKLTDNFRVGLAYFSPIEMGHLSGYRNVFAGHTDMDIPQRFIAGAAYDITPKLTAAFDYEWIDWSDLHPLGNKFPGDGVLGTRDGPGTGWRNQNVYRGGLSYDINDTWTVRVGGSYSSKLFGSRQNTLNFITPVTMRVHLSVGATYNLNERNQISFGWNRAMTRTQHGTGLSTGTDLKAHIDTFGLSYGWKF